MQDHLRQCIPELSQPARALHVLRCLRFRFRAAPRAQLQAIKRELDPLLPSSFIAWPERALYGHGWDVFGLYAFGNKLHDNCARCHETTRAVESIPGLRTAGFSMLQPGTHIRPHVGYSNAVLRCHLGLIVPEGCTMRVGAEIRTWEEGRCLIFDDTTEHEVWHRGSEFRVVLLIDFVRTHAGELAPGPRFV